MTFTIDHHIEAVILLFGMVIDLFGGLYLAYDLLGGHNGPLHRITEMVTIGTLCVLTGLVGAAFVIEVGLRLHLHILSVIGFLGTLGAGLGFGAGGGGGLALGYGFEITRPRKMSKNVRSNSGPGFGTRGEESLVLGYGFEITRPRKMSKNVRSNSKFFSKASYSLAGGIIVGSITSLAMITGPSIIHSFLSGLLSGLFFGLTGGFIAGFLGSRFLIHNPILDSMNKPKFEWSGLLFGQLITIPGGIIAAIGYWLSYGPENLNSLRLSIVIGILVGIIGGVGGGIGVGFARRVDWWVNKLAPTRMGFFGIILVLVGFSIQSLQYWIQLLDIHVR